MMMSQSQAQQTTSPLFVDEDENNVENVVIDVALPFDKCLSVDKQCEEEENINRKNREMLKYQNKLGDAKTTLKDSKKQIDNWLGKNIIFKYRLNYIIIGIIGLVMIAALIYFIPIIIKSDIDYHDTILNYMKLFMNGIILIFIVLLTFILFTLLFDLIIMFKRELVEKKMSRDDYLINSNIVDCPMKIKTELFNDLVDRKYLYISYDKKENILKFYKDYSNEALYEYNLNEHKNFIEKDSLEYQYWYLCEQLKDNKFYRISDIITDNAIKEKDVHE